MSSRDIRFGRQGGRVVAWVSMENGPRVRVVCACVDVAWWVVAPSSVGEPCWDCHTPLVRVA